MQLLNHMSDDRQTWLQHSFHLAVFTAFFHALQFAVGVVLFARTNSSALLAYALDAMVSSLAASVLSRRILRHGSVDIRDIQERWLFRGVAFGYMAAALVAFFMGVFALWSSARAAPGISGIILASVSMLVIPIIGSYMKTLAVELRSRRMKSAAVFTFGNSYLSMVLLIALLLNTGMDLGWGDPGGALVMFPFMMQKGIQILLDEGKQEYVED